MARIILHIDLNQFFVRCEEIKNPYLIGKPVAVGGDGRKGIVSTCSYEARKYGIHSGMPTFQAKMLCKNIIILPGDYKFYELMSKEFINFVRNYTHSIEQMSIDECFCDFTNVIKAKRITKISKKRLTNRASSCIIYLVAALGTKCDAAHQLGSIAQLGEHLPYKQRVTGSSPVVPTNFIMAR